MKHNPTFRIQRRSFLAGLGTGAATASVRPLIAQAQTGTAPQRTPVIHRPCGTDTAHWFPTGGLTESADSTRDCCLRVVSYSKTDPAAAFPTPLWPESRASVAFMHIFGKAPTGMDPALLARIQAQNKSVLDYISGGLTSLRGRLPASQLPKLDAHLTAVRDLEKNLGAVGGSRQCVPPTLATLGAPPAGISQLDSDHYQSTLNH